MKQHQFARKPASLTLAVAIAQLFAPAAAHAADTAPAATGAIEEVIVTAQKRKENLQNVPISIQALSAKDIEKHNIVTLADIGAEVPGLNLAPYPGSSEAFFPTFRGITTNAVFISAPNPVAFHVDGVFRSQLVGLNNTAGDIERLEVLKGPQGVLSGRNATGGAVNLHYAKAELGEFAFKQQFTFANRGQFLSRTVVNLPIKDDLAMRLSYLHRQKDSDGVTNTATGGVQFGKLNGDGYRLDLRWKPVNNVTLDYAYDNTETKSYDTPPQCLVAGHQSVYGGYLSALAGTDPRLASYMNGCSMSKLDKLYVPYNFEKNTNKTESHTLNLNWEASPTFSFRSITGFHKIDTSNHYTYAAYGGNAIAVAAASYPTTLNLANGSSMSLGQPMKLYNEAWSQEFQFIGDLAKNLKYTAGLYFSSEDGHQSSGPNMGFYAADAAQGADLLMLDNKGLTSAKSDSRAAYAHVTWTPEILDNKLDIVPGIRFTRDHRAVVGYNTGWYTGYAVGATAPGVLQEYASFPTGGAPMSNVTGDRSWAKTTPAIPFNYHWQKDLMTYFKYSTAYTSGGFDPVAGPPSAAADFAKGFNPETVKSFELGLKGEFLERRLRTNVAVFQTKFSNEQKSTYVGSGGWATVNVGGSTYNGLEFDLTAALTRELRLGLNYAYLSHKYNRWTDPTSGKDVTALRDLTVPKNDYSVNLDYRVPDVGLPGKLDMNLNFTHRDASSTPIDLTSKNLPDARTPFTTPAFSIWNARIALSQIKAGPKDEGRVTVAVWAKNLTDKKYLVMANPGVAADMSGNWGEPRSVGMDLIYKY